MTDPSGEGDPAPGGAASAGSPSYKAADRSTYYDSAPLIAYYGPDGQVAYHPAPDGYQPPPDATYAPPSYPPAPEVASPREDRGLPPDAGWAALRDAVWEPGPAQPHPWPEGPAWGRLGVPQAASMPRSIPAPPDPEPTAATTPVTTDSGTKTAAHKVVPRPTAAHRISTARPPDGTGFRASQVPYRIGIARRLRSAFALILISVVLAGVLAAVLVAIVAGIASAISHAASN
ncbi:MAG: hypothetical protein M3Y36_02890 [Actinomycetota bacterium]|nr:hypothetical protein [Actinomycetota bacterium]